MADIITFRDYYKVTPITEEQQVEFKDFVSAPGNRSLRVRMEATHCGLINSNRKFYIPSRMAEGMGSWRTEEKPTKILKHHDMHSDPIGVLRGARFVPTIPEELQDNPDVMTLMSSSASIKDQLASYRNLAASGILTDKDWRGLGYTELIGDIMDEESIKQIGDGRYDAVSTYFIATGKVFCSHCDQNLALDGPCEHEWGSPYPFNADDEDSPPFPMIVIPAHHNNQEVSLITKEADKLATIEVFNGNVKDESKSVFLPANWAEGAFADSMTFEFKDAKEDNMPVPQLSETEQKVLDTIKKLREDAKDETLVEQAKTIAALYDKDGSLPFQVEASLDEELAVKYALEDLETADKEINGDETCDEMQVELKAMLDAKLITKEEYTEADAKLSPEKRKSLAKSTFCGPKRSFPVPDCAHVTAAKRLIDRYEGPGNKSSILAGIARKDKALGQSPKSKDDPDAASANVNLLPINADSVKEMKDDEVRNLYYAVEMELIGRGQKVSYDCKDCETHKAETDKAKELMTDATKQVSDLEDILRILRDELRLIQTEYSQQVDAYVEQGAILHSTKVEKIALIGVLNKKYDNLENAIESLKDCDVDTQEAVVKDGFELEAVMDKINDGMARSPSEEVEDPTIVTDGENNQLPEGLSAPAVEAISNIKDLVQDGQTSDARHIYDTMVALKLFDKDKMTFDSLSAENDGPAE